MLVSRRTAACSRSSHAAVKMLPGIRTLARPTTRCTAPTMHKSGTALSATMVPSSSPDMQIYVVDGEQMEVPITAVQQLPTAAQAAVFVGIMAALGLSTYAVLTLTDMGWAHSPLTPYSIAGPFVLAGVAHFLVKDAFCSMMPTRGAWGLWYLPGSDEFHVEWTGVAEVLGGLGMLAAQVPAVQQAVPWLYNASAAGMFALAVAVTPSNIFMATHNAPGPGPKGTVIPLWGHLARGALQVFLWSVLYDAAFN